MRFASLLSGGFITAIVVNPSERKLAKRTSVHCVGVAGQVQEGRVSIKANVSLISLVSGVQG